MSTTSMPRNTPVSSGGMLLGCLGVECLGALAWWLASHAPEDNRVQDYRRLVEDWRARTST